jgi:hypothetical protein
MTPVATGRALDPRDQAVASGVPGSRKGRVELDAESVAGQERTQIARGKVSPTERARIEVGPLGIHRAHEQDPRRPEDPARFANELVGVLEIVERFVEDHGVERSGSERERLGVEPDEGNPRAVVPAGDAQQVVGVVAATTRAALEAR